MEKSFSLLYFLKQSGTEPKKYIYLRITVDGHPVELSTKKQWWENRWDQEKSRASGVKQDAQEVNFFLDTLENKVFKARKQLIEDDELITAELLRDMLTTSKWRRWLVRIMRMERSNVTKPPMTIRRHLFNGSTRPRTGLYGSWITSLLSSMRSG